MVDMNHKNEDDDVIVDDESLPENLDIDLEAEDATLRDKLKTLRSKLLSCEEEKRKHLEELQRTRADFLNSRRRLEEQLERDKERAADKILMELLVLIDSFDTAMSDKALWEAIEPKWRTGVEAIHTKLLAILKSNQVTPIDPIGEIFNPEEHEAVSNTVVANDNDVEKIMAVLQRGFKRKDTIIRPARVVVGTKE